LHISAISKSCLYDIRSLKRLRSTIDQSTARIIATALIHSKLDYCNSLLLNLPASHLNRLQLVLNSAARAVTRTSKFGHISPIIKDLYWLKINERIKYKILSLTYKILITNQPSYLRSLLEFQAARSTRSSSVITLIRPSNPSRLKLTDRSFYHQAPALSNSLPADLRIPSDNFLTHHSVSNSSPFALSVSNFHKNLKPAFSITPFLLSLLSLSGRIYFLDLAMIFFISQSIFICHSPHFTLIAFVLELSQCLRIRCHDYCSSFKGTLNPPFPLIFISDHFVYHFIHLLTFWRIFDLILIFDSANSSPYFF
jgi:hypothetical protein